MFHPTLFPDTQLSCASQVGFYHLLEALLLGPHFPSPRLCGVIIISVRTIWPSTVPEFLYWYHLHSTAVLYFLPIKDAYWGWAKLRPRFLLLLASIYLLFQWWSLPMFWFLILQSSFQVACFKCLPFAYKTLSPQKEQHQVLCYYFVNKSSYSLFAVFDPLDFLFT